MYGQIHIILHSVVWCPWCGVWTNMCMHVCQGVYVYVHTCVYICTCIQSVCTCMYVCRHPWLCVKPDNFEWITDEHKLYHVPIHNVTTTNFTCCCSHQSGLTTHLHHPWTNCTHIIKKTGWYGVWYILYPVSLLYHSCGQLCWVSKITQHPGYFRIKSCSFSSGSMRFPLLQELR